MEIASDEFKNSSSDNVKNPALENGVKTGADNPEIEEGDPDQDLDNLPGGQEGETPPTGDPEKTMMSENTSGSQFRSNTSGVFSQTSHDWELGGSVDPHDAGAQSKKKEKMFIKKVEENNYIQVQAMLWKQK